jgi:hypothetical protein
MQGMPATAAAAVVPREVKARTSNLQRNIEDMDVPQATSVERPARAAPPFF